jgi:hypothetical protein
MMWLRSHRRSAWICGLTLLIPFVFYANSLFGLWDVRQAYQSDIDDLIPRIARQYGLIGHEDELRKSSNVGSKEIAKLAYPASTDAATASAALQTNVREVLSSAGLTVSNSQVLPVREKEHFDYISVKLTVQGELSELNSALTDIAAFKPLLLVEALEVRTDKSGRKDARKHVVIASLQLLSLRAVL